MLAEIDNFHKTMIDKTPVTDPRGCDAPQQKYFQNRSKYSCKTATQIFTADIRLLNPEDCASNILALHTTLLFCARMKLAQIQCKSQINRYLSSQVTLDGHCLHGKVASCCPPTSDKVAQSCSCVHACMQAPRGF